MNRGMQTAETLFAELRLLINKIGDSRTCGPHMPLELASTIKAVCAMCSHAQILRLPFDALPLRKNWVADRPRTDNIGITNPLLCRLGYSSGLASLRWLLL